MNAMSNFFCDFSEFTCQSFNLKQLWYKMHADIPISKVKLLAIGVIKCGLQQT